MPGIKLPTERDFSIEFKTTLWTIHTVMNELEENGFLERHRSIGTFVRDNIAMQKVIREKNRNSKNIISIAARDFFYTRYGFEDIIGQMERLLEKKGYNVLYEDMPRNSEMLGKFLNDCVMSDINTIVVFPERNEFSFMYDNSDLFVKFPGDILYFNRGIEAVDYLPFNCVSVDMLQSGKTAASWITDKGFKEIVFTCGEESFSTYWLSNRYNGFKYELDRHDISHKLIIGKNTGLVFKPVADFIKKAKSVPVIVACHDIWAAEIYDYLESVDIKACRDYFMLGFENHPGYRNYKFASVTWPLEKVGELMADTIEKTLCADFHSTCSLKYQLRSFVNEHGINMDGKLSGTESGK